MRRLLDFVRRPLGIALLARGFEPRAPLLNVATSPCGELAGVLFGGADDLRDPYAGLMDIGLDSLMAVELRTALTERLQLSRSLSATLIMDYPTMDAIATHLEQELLSATPASAPVVTEVAARVELPLAEAGRTENGEHTDIDALSEEEAEALLLRRLESLQEPV